jgi:hypothetical protein
MDSIGLFCTINNPADHVSQYNEYVLVSNARIANFRDPWIKYSFNRLNKEIKDKIESLESIRDNIEILQNIYFLRGPPLLEIASIIVSGLLHTLNDGQYNILKIKDDMLSYIDNMCPGPTDIEDMKIINDNETDDYNLKHKTITKEQIERIIKNNKLSDEARQKYVRVTRPFTLRYNINAPNPSNEQLEGIHQLIDEYWGITNDNLMLTYMQKLSEKVGKFNLYKDDKLLNFLKQTLYQSNDKHIILEALHILHILILTSKSEHDKSFIEYIHKEYFSLLKQQVEAEEERFKNSLDRIQQIIQEIRELVSDQELCETYWKRMVSIIQSVKKTEITDNKLWNCIGELNKCKIRKEWRDWLIADDEYSDIKIEVIKELRNF